MTKSKTTKKPKTFKAWGVFDRHGRLFSGPYAVDMRMLVISPDPHDAELFVRALGAHSVKRVTITVGE